jgi:hypothetical protein
VSWIAARAETAEFTPITAEAATPRFFPEPIAEKKKGSIVRPPPCVCRVCRVVGRVVFN